MVMREVRIALVTVMVMLVALLAGCATTERRVTVLYQPVVHGVTGSGILHLIKGNRSSDRADIRWILGKVKNSEGKQVGDIVSTESPTDLVMDAFNQELTTAGYDVRIVGLLSPEAPKGIVLTDAEISSEDVSGLIKEEGTSRIKIAVDLWKNGAKIKRLSYESDYSDSATNDREFLIQTTLQKALQAAMAKAIPEIIAALEH